MRALRRFDATLRGQVDGASMALFRTGFGVLMAGAALRFVAKGWVESLLLAPTMHFPWFPWAVVPSPQWLYGLFAAQVLAGICVAVGVAVRPALAIWLASFGYVELLDKALYLNHYVLFTMLGASLLVLPRGDRIPRWALWWVRLQVSLVYLWAGLAKLNADWLFRAEPLRTWLGALGDMPLVGPVLAWPATAWLMSWGGAAYDLSVPFLLLHPRTRRLGVALVVGFHVVVGALFPIGVFPWLMVLGATTLLDPSWPRRGGRPVPTVTGQVAGLGVALGWLCLGAILALLPARFLWWGTDVSWTEQGYRFSWRVLLNEKSGLVDFRVVEHDTGRVWKPRPSQILTPWQLEQMQTQPDLIRDFALHLQSLHRAQGRQVAVHADAWASLNGRPSQRFLRADVDLTRPVHELQQQGWILPQHPPDASP